MDYPGKLIRKTPLVPTQTSASGVWTMTEAMDAVKANTWPVAGTPLPMQQSLRFRASATAYLNRTPTVASNRKTWTWSGWVKRGVLSSGQTLFYGQPDGSTVSWNGTNFYFLSDNTLRLQQGNSPNGYYTTSAVFRDPSAWYHIVLAVDTTQATAGNRVKIYVNGVLQTLTTGGTTYSQNDNTWVNLNTPQFIGIQEDSPRVAYFDGYLSEVNFIDGQALTPSSFGQTDPQTGVWQAIPYTGTYGTNGFYLPFKNTSNVGQDYSGNANNWTANNISTTAGSTYDIMADTPTQWLPAGSLNGNANARGNYCVLNPLSKGANVSATNGNLNAVISGAPAESLQSTLGMSSGKWYCEMTAGGGGSIFGITTVGANLSSWVGSDSKGYGYRGDTAQVMYNGSALVSGMSSFTSGDIISLAFDADAGKLWFAKNGTWYNSGSPSAGTNATVSSIASGTWFVSVGRINTTNDAQFNFGQQPFTYTPPTGFVALNTYNLPTSTIVQGNKYMDATLYTANQTVRNITNDAGFKPDLVWIKGRSNAWNNALFDSVRGAGKWLISNATNAESSQDLNTLSSFNSNGFGLGDNSSGTAVNFATGQTFVGWQWQAGQGTTSSNTNGSITSTVSVNATAGFSIVTWTGTGALATVGHGLGVAPKFIINKQRDGSTYSWNSYHASLGNTYYISLNTTSAADNSVNLWNSTSPTSSVFTVNYQAAINPTGGTMVSYCWAEIAGFSKFGSYTGNGSSDGPFVYTGFRPKFVLYKKSSGNGNWQIMDTSRSTYNVMDGCLFPNLTNAETFASSLAIDFLSNGFKLRNTDTDRNESGQTYIYACFAENPFKNSLAR